MKNPIIFIVGMSRSGTTLMSQVLNRNQDIYILKETHFIREIIKKVGKKLDYNKIKRIVNKFLTIQKKGIYKSNELENNNEIVSKVYKLYEEKGETIYGIIRYLFQLEAEKKGKTIAGDQTPNHILYIDELVKNFENIKIINMIRDYRAVIASQKYKYIMAKTLKQPKMEVLRARINYHPITQGILWNKAINEAYKAINKYGEDKIIFIRYEDLIENPENEIKRITKFIGIKYEKSMLNINVGGTSNIERKEKKGFDKYMLDAWQKKINNTEIYIINKICKKNANKLGYYIKSYRPNIIKLYGYLVIFPIHCMLVFTFNFKRIIIPLLGLRN